MKFLMDSRGEYIASVIDRRLYSPTGDNIGHYLPEFDIFIDQSGRYLGEIVSDERQMRRSARNWLHSRSSVPHTTSASQGSGA